MVAIEQQDIASLSNLFATELFNMFKPMVSKGLVFDELPIVESDDAEIIYKSDGDVKLCIIVGLDTTSALYFVRVFFVINKRRYRFDVSVDNLGNGYVMQKMCDNIIYSISKHVGEDDTTIVDIR